MDGFEGKLTSSKWAKIAKCSKDSAIRDINDLIEKTFFERSRRVEEVRIMSLLG